MKHIAFFLALSATLISACSKQSHASTGEAWSLTLSTEGTAPAKAPRYQWKTTASTPCRLEIQSSSKDIEVPKSIAMLLSMTVMDNNPNRTVLSVRVEDLQDGTGRKPALWSTPIAFEWVMTKRGRTVAFRQEGDSPPIVLTGLPDLALLFSRLTPTFPAKPIGQGAVWTKTSGLDMTIPGPTGFGSIRASDSIRYELKERASSSATVTATGTTSYKGMLHPVGHTMKLTGSGRLESTTKLVAGRIATSQVSVTDQIKVMADGHRRTVSVQYTASLRCGPRATDGRVTPARLPKPLSQQVATPKLIPSRRR